MARALDALVRRWIGLTSIPASRNPASTATSTPASAAIPVARLVRLRNSCSLVFYLKVNFGSRQDPGDDLPIHFHRDGVLDQVGGHLVADLVAESWDQSAVIGVHQSVQTPQIAAIRRLLVRATRLLRRRRFGTGILAVIIEKPIHRPIVPVVSLSKFL